MQQRQDFLHCIYHTYRCNESIGGEKMHKTTGDLFHRLRSSESGILVLRGAALPTRSHRSCGMSCPGRGSPPRSGWRRRISANPTIIRSCVGNGFPGGTFCCTQRWRRGLPGKCPAAAGSGRLRFPLPVGTAGRCGALRFEPAYAAFGNRGAAFLLAGAEPLHRGALTWICGNVFCGDIRIRA